MKYGLKAMRRSSGKSLLFFLLIGLVAVFLSLGVGMWYASELLLRQADGALLPAGELIYLGGNYPNNRYYDARLHGAIDELDARGIAGHRAVSSWEAGVLQRAWFAGYAPPATEMPYPEMSVVAVQAGGDGISADTVSARITEIFYSEKIDETQNVYLLPPAADPDFAYVPGHTYLLFGTLQRITGVQLPGLTPVAFADVTLNRGGPDPDQFPSLIDITDWSEADMALFWAGDTGQYYLDITETLDVLNHSVTLAPTGDAEAVSEFHRGLYELIEGDFFQEGDYRQGGACLVPARIASQLGLEVGDG